MRQLRRLAVGLVVLAVLAGCAADLGEPSARIRQSVAESGATGASRVDIDKNSVWLRYIDGDQAMTATKFKKDDLSTEPSNSADLVQRPLNELDLDGFAARLAAVHDACGGDDFGGQLSATLGGAAAQQFGCAYSSYTKAYIAAQELAPITTWDEATLDRVLGEVRAVHGATTRDLLFQTPKGTAARAQYSLHFVSADQTGLDGKPCRLGNTRYGELAEDRSLFSYAGECMDEASLSDADFPLDQVTGAKIMAALDSGAQKMGISVDDIGSFTVILSKGTLKAQILPGKGVPAKLPIWAEPLI